MIKLNDYYFYKSAYQKMLLICFCNNMVTDSFFNFCIFCVMFALSVRLTTADNKGARAARCTILNHYCH